MSLVAVIIVNYNAGTMLRDCLAALQAQAMPAARVLVVDNGSSDDSIAEARKAHPWAEYHLLNANLGFAKANNVGIDLTGDCEWVALLNPDAFAEPGWIAAFERWALKFPDVDTFASRMVSAQDTQVVDGAGDAYRVDGLAWPRHQGGATRQLPGEPEEVFSPCAGAAFYRRDALVAAGGFCERYFCYYEDVDLGFRLRLRGSRCLALPDAVVRHMGSAITGKGSDFSVYHAHRNNVWTFLRNMPGAYMWWYLPAHLAANLASVAVMVRKGQGRTIFKAKWDALKGLRLTMHERRRIQADVKVAPRDVLAAMQPGNLFRSLYYRALRSLRSSR